MPERTLLLRSWSLDIDAFDACGEALRLVRSRSCDRAGAVTGPSVRDRYASSSRRCCLRKRATEVCTRYAECLRSAKGIKATSQTSTTTRTTTRYLSLADECKLDPCHSSARQGYLRARIHPWICALWKDCDAVVGERSLRRARRRRRFRRDARYLTFRRSFPTAGAHRSTSCGPTTCTCRTR